MTVRLRKKGCGINDLDVCTTKRGPTLRPIPFSLKKSVDKHSKHRTSIVANGASNLSATLDQSQPDASSASSREDRCPKRHYLSVWSRLKRTKGAGFPLCTREEIPMTRNQVAGYTGFIAVVDFTSQQAWTVFGESVS